MPDFQKSKKIVKFEIILNKSVENSGKSDKNCTTSGNSYYLVPFEIVLYRGSY